MPRTGNVAVGNGKDLLGNSYIVEGDNNHIGVVHVNQATVAALKNIVQPDYWEPYGPLVSETNR